MIQKIGFAPVLVVAVRELQDLTAAQTTTAVKAVTASP
jgi:hypothetical protein